MHRLRAICENMSGGRFGVHTARHASLQRLYNCMHKSTALQPCRGSSATRLLMSHCIQVLAGTLPPTHLPPDVRCEKHPRNSHFIAHQPCARAGAMFTWTRCGLRMSSSGPDRGMAAAEVGWEGTPVQTYLTGSISLTIGRLCRGCMLC